MTGCNTCRVSDRVVSEYIEDRIGKEVIWGVAPSVGDYIEKALVHELGVDHAVQIALLNNPQIQVLFEEVGVAHADLIQAGLFRNPVFDLLVRFPDTGGLKTNIDYTVALSFLDIFKIPLRKKVARAAFEKTELEVSHAILDLAFDVEQTYYSLIAERRRQEMLKGIRELKEGAYEIARAQEEAGNVGAQVVAGHRIDALAATMDQRESEIEVIQLRHRLNRLMGLDGKGCLWHVPDTLSLPHCEDETVCTLRERALCARLDLKAIECGVAQIARMGALKEWWAYTEIMAGISGEREPEGEWVTGPALSGEIPLFDVGQAQRARLTALMNQQINEYKKLRIGILNDVSENFESMQILKSQVERYVNALLPEQDNLFVLSQKLYNVMAISPFQLIQSKRDQYQKEIEYVLLLREYWLSRVKLKRAVGGKL